MVTDMIIKVKEINPYGKYFLATEADDDETEEEATPKKRNVKVVSAGPNKSRKDFTKVQDDNDSTSESNGEPETSDDEQDFTDTADESNSDDGGGESDTESPDDTSESNDEPETSDDEQDFTDTADESNSDDGDNSSSDDGGDTGGDESGDEGSDEGGEDDGPELGEDDDTDFTDTGDDSESGEDGGEDNSGDSNSGNDKNEVSADLNSTRKYNLYKEYMSLYNSCSNYISKLENVIKDDAEQNQIIRVAVNNLRKIKDLIFDYMTIRFSINTYVQSLLFYQKMVVSIQLVFKMLTSLKKNEQPEKKH